MTKRVGKKPLEHEIRDKTAIIRFCNPDSKNALSIDVLTILQDLMSGYDSDPNLQSVIFTGSDDIFAAGADIRQVAGLSKDQALDFARFGQEVFMGIRNSPKKTIAAINGFCMGGALDLALSCEIRIAAPKAVFAHPGPKLGIITGWGGTQMLPRLIGRKNSYYMLLTADRIGASTALEMRLVDEVVLDPFERALEFSGELK